MSDLLDALYGPAPSAPPYTGILIDNLFATPLSFMRGKVTQIQRDRLPSMLTGEAMIRWRAAPIPLNVGPNFDRDHFKTLFGAYYGTARCRTMNIEVSIERVVIPFSHSFSRVISKDQLFAGINQSIRRIPLEKKPINESKDLMGWRPIGIDDRYEEVAELAIEDGSMTKEISAIAGAHGVVGAWTHGFIPTFVRYAIRSGTRIGVNDIGLLIVCSFSLSDVWRVRASFRINFVDEPLTAVDRITNYLLDTTQTSGVTTQSVLDDVIFEGVRFVDIIDRAASRGVDRYNLDLIYLGDRLYDHIEEALMPMIGVSRCKEIFYASHHFERAWSVINPYLKGYDPKIFTRVNASPLRKDPNELNPRVIDATFPILEVIQSALTESRFVFYPIVKGDVTKLIIDRNGLFFDSLSVDQSMRHLSFRCLSDQTSSFRRADQTSSFRRADQMDSAREWVPTGGFIFDAVRRSSGVRYCITRVLVFDGVSMFGSIEAESIIALRSEKMKMILAAINRISIDEAFIDASKGEKVEQISEIVPIAEIIPFADLDHNNFTDIIEEAMETEGTMIMNSSTIYLQNTRAISRYRVRSPKKTTIEFLLRRVKGVVVSSIKLPPGKVYIAYVSTNPRSINSMPTRSARVGMWRSKHFSTRRFTGSAPVEFMTTILENSFFVIDPPIHQTSDRHDSTCSTTTHTDTMVLPSRDLDDQIVECAFIDGWFRPLEVNVRKTTSYRGGLPVYGDRYNDALCLLPVILEQSFVRSAPLDRQPGLFQETSLIEETVRAILYRRHTTDRDETQILIDIGSGSGDDARRAYYHGSRIVYSIDRDISALVEYSQTAKRIGRRQRYTTITYPMEQKAIPNSASLSVRSIIGMPCLESAHSIFYDTHYHLAGADLIVGYLSLETLFVDAAADVLQLRSFLDRTLGNGSQARFFMLNVEAIDNILREPHLPWQRRKDGGVEILDTRLEYIGQLKYSIVRDEESYRIFAGREAIYKRIERVIFDSAFSWRSRSSISFSEHDIRFHRYQVERLPLTSSSPFFEAYSQVIGRPGDPVTIALREDLAWMSIFQLVSIDGIVTRT